MDSTVSSPSLAPETPLSQQLEEQDLRLELQACQRSLIRTQAETLAAEGRAQEAEEEHQEQLAVLCAQLDALDAHLLSEHSEQTEESRLAGRLLDEAREQVREMNAEVRAAHAEGDLIETLASSGRSEVESSLRRTLCKERLLAEEVSGLHATAEALRRELSDQQDEGIRLEERRGLLEEALRRENAQVQAFEDWSLEVHAELREVAAELRADQAAGAEECLMLQERAADLERRRDIRKLDPCDLATITVDEALPAALPEQRTDALCDNTSTGRSPLSLIAEDDLRALHTRALREHATLLHNVLGSHQVKAPLPTTDAELINWILHVQHLHSETLPVSVESPAVASTPSQSPLAPATSGLLAGGGPVRRPVSSQDVGHGAPRCLGLMNSMMPLPESGEHPRTTSSSVHAESLSFPDPLPSNIRTSAGSPEVGSYPARSHVGFLGAIPTASGNTLPTQVSTPAPNGIPSRFHSRPAAGESNAGLPSRAEPSCNMSSGSALGPTFSRPTASSLVADSAGKSGLEPLWCHKMPSRHAPPLSANAPSLL